MEYLKNCQPLLGIAFCALFILGTSARSDAQEDVYVKVARFSILVETSGDEIKLTCNDGCAWKQLIFNSSIKSDPQAIDQNGMTTIPLDPGKAGSLHPKFLFTIKRTQEGVSLVGKEGTMWPSLTFNCTEGNCLRSIDGWGVTDLKKK